MSGVWREDRVAHSKNVLCGRAWKKACEEQDLQDNYKGELLRNTNTKDRHNLYNKYTVYNRY